MNYSFSTTNSIEQIFGGILVGELKNGNESEAEITSSVPTNLRYFKASFPINVFQDEYAVFYDIIVNKNILVFNKKQLFNIIENNRDMILNSPYINLSKIDITESGGHSVENEKIEYFKDSMGEKLETLSNTYVPTIVFESACNAFIDDFRNQFMLETAQHMSMIMSDAGFDNRINYRRTEHLHGVSDCSRYYNDRMHILSSLDTENKLRETVLDKEYYLQHANDDTKADANALMTVGIKDIDEHIGDLRRGNMIGILGPPKGGKTRFTNFLVQRALGLGLNVCVWPLEGTKEEWIAMQMASYIARKNNRFINSKEILQNKYKDNAERVMVTSARFEQVNDESYGTLSFIESTAYCEDFIDVLKSHYENINKYDVIVIDSLVNILSRTGKNKVDRISSAYMLLKSFITNNLPRQALAIIPAQLKQDVVDFLRSHPNETIDVTAGGESAETIRTPDEVIGLFSSKEERAANLMKMYSVASRHSEAFSDFTVGASLKCCHFYDKDIQQ